MLERDVIAWLESRAPLSLAGDWDNVGLLLESASTDRQIDRVFLCIDLTPAVFAEAVKLGAHLIVAYHPPIFSGLRALRWRTPQDRVLLEAIQRGMNIYSPHTALDATEGGVADWLLDGLGPVATREPIEAAVDRPALGPGRIGRLAARRSVDDLVAALKAHLGLAHVRVATQRTRSKPSVERVAVCPGAGGSLFAAVRGADLFVTGEMRHHDILTRVRQGATVILTDHTNCERGYLPLLGAALESALPGVEVHVSEADRDPLEVV